MDTVELLSESYELLIFFVVKTLQGFLFPPAHIIKMKYDFRDPRNWSVKTGDSYFCGENIEESTDGKE